MLSIVAGSIYLQNFTAVKWEKYDERHRTLGEQEMLSMIDNKRKVDKKEDYYRLQGFMNEQKDNDFDYEMVRVKRKKEDEPVW